MRAWRRSRFFVADVVVIVVVAIIVVVLGVTASGSQPAPTPTTEASVSDQPIPGIRPVPPGFLGLSLEYPALEAYAGTDPNAINPVFVQLVRNLAPGQSPVIRIGGDSADWTWWPVPGVTRPPGVTYTLSDNWLRVAHALVQAFDARLILGLNLEADDTQLAQAEATALADGIGSGRIEAFELGNEPELYGGFPWYRTASGQGVTGRPHSYDFDAFSADFSQFAIALPQLPLAGPTSARWIPQLEQFLSDEPAVQLVTVHRYPLQVCFVGPGSPQYPSIANLLSPTASHGLADQFSSAVAAAHARGIQLRVDELNTVSCGADTRISDTFASALWALDTLFAMARVGVDGVNIHTFPGAGYELFHFTRADGRWRATVAPEYYGLELFAQAAPPGSELLQTTITRGDPVRLWATLASDHRIRVVLINTNASRDATVAIHLPASASGTVVRLQAPSLSANGDVTLGGRGFGRATDTGTLGPPRAAAVGPTDGRYLVRVRAASAALLTVPIRGL